MKKSQRRRPNKRLAKALRDDKITEAINAALVYAKEGRDPFLDEAARRTLARTEWRMDIRPIRTDDALKLALARVDALMGAKLDTPEGDELDILVTLIHAYEEQHYPIPMPDPIDAILFRIDQMEFSREDLRRAIGCSRRRLSELLSRKRPLTLAVIRKLNQKLHISAEVLIQDPTKPRRGKRVSADAIGRMAARGEDVSRFFAKKGRMMPPLKR